jgi:hypothetical protein
MKLHVVAPFLVAGFIAIGCGGDGKGKTTGAAGASGTAGMGASGNAGTGASAGSGGTEAGGGATGEAGAVGTAGTGAVGGGGAGGTPVTTGTAGAGSGPMFVASGNNRRTIVSTDGKTWVNDQEMPAGTGDNVATAVAIGHGAITVGSHPGVWRSTDGATWTKLGAPLPQAFPGLGGGAGGFGNGTLLLVTNETTYTSTDGSTWVEHDKTGNGIHWNGLAYGGGHFVVGGDSNAMGGMRKTSEDGAVWHDYATGVPTVSAVAYGAGVFVIVGQETSTSPDGVTWTKAATKSPSNTVTFGAGKFVACDNGGCATSTDGSHWGATMGKGAVAVTFGLGLFVADQGGTTIATSTDGTTWTTAYTKANAGFLQRVTFGYLD